MVREKAHLNPLFALNYWGYLHIWLAEITDGHLLEMRTDQVPAWFKNALGSKFNIDSKM